MEEKIKIDVNKIELSKKKRFSYSKLNTYDTCPFSYFLKYVQHHYFYTDNLAAEFGTLVHYIEEMIGNNIKNNEEINYEKLKYDFVNINLPKKDKKDRQDLSTKQSKDSDDGILGINALKEKYREEFFEMDEDTGENYFTKAHDYMTKGIYRLENFMKNNPNYKIVDLEKKFEIEVNDIIFYGFIDKIIQDTESGEYLIFDIKTKDHLFTDKDLATPLQFVFYSIAVKETYHLENYPSLCFYDLPIVNTIQQAGTKGFLSRGFKKLTTILQGIKEEEWKPKPGPLCHWCDFCPTCERQPEEGKDLCFYFSYWNEKEPRNFKTFRKWEGLEVHKNLKKKIENDFFTPEEAYTIENGGAKDFHFDI